MESGTEPLRDAHGRTISDLRVSVTDRCNFRCQYCMPADGLPWLERDEVLSFEEIERLVGLLVRLGIESAPAGSVLHAVDEEGIATREIAEAIGRSVGVPTRSVPAAQVGEHFGWIGRFFSMDSAVSSDLTRDLLGWKPVRPGLLAVIDAGGYADVVPHAQAG